MITTQDTLTVAPPVEPAEEVVAQPTQQVAQPTQPVAQPSTHTDTVAHHDTTAIAPAAAQQRFTLPDSIAPTQEIAEVDSEPAIPDSLPLLYPNFFATDSLLARDSLLFCAEKDGRSTFGMSAQRLPSALHRNDGVTAVLLCCFILTMSIIRNSQHKLGERLKEFFFPSHNSSNPPTENEGREFTHLFLGLQLSLLIALIFYSYAQAHLPLVSIPLKPLALLGIYALVAFLMLVAKQVLYAFVHSVFFTTTQRRKWYRDFSLLFAIESLCLFPIALLSVYFDLPYQTAALLLAILLIFVKIFFLFKCFDAFFEKFHGIFHLFVYLCALEIAPIVLLWSTLVELTQMLTEI